MYFCAVIICLVFSHLWQIELSGRIAVETSDLCALTIHTAHHDNKLTMKSEQLSVDL